MPNIELSESQCKNVADFIEFNFFQMIREDDDIDNFNYIVDMVNAYQVLRGAEDGKDVDVSTKKPWEEAMMNTFCGGKV